MKHALRKSFGVWTHMSSYMNCAVVFERNKKVLRVLHTYTTWDGSQMFLHAMGRHAVCNQTSCYECGHRVQCKNTQLLKKWFAAILGLTMSDSTFGITGVLFWQHRTTFFLTRFNELQTLLYSHFVFLNVACKLIALFTQQYWCSLSSYTDTRGSFLVISYLEQDLRRF